MKKRLKQTLLQLENISIDRLIEDYINIIQILQKRRIVNTDTISCYGNIIPPDIEIKKKVIPRKIILYPKFLFLIHLIISQCRKAKNNIAHLHSKRLKNVLGDDYSLLLKVLADNKIIIIKNDYTIGAKCRSISLQKWEIKETVLSNIKIDEYIQKWNKQLENDIRLYKNYTDEKILINEKGEIQIIEKEVLHKENNKFIQDYNNALSYLRMRIDKKQAHEYVDKIIQKKNNHLYHYYHTIIDDFNNHNNKITSIDNQFRIYHFLTNLKKELRPLFNIKYQLDIANSHPLLICELIIVRYKIGMEALKMIYNHELNEDIHNVSEQLYNKLYTNNIQIPMDIIRFLFICSKGLIWDEMQDSFKGYTRNEIKHKAFSQIFYHPKDIAIHTKFGQMFIKSYPHVYEVINEVKQLTNLPLFLMKLESSLMREVLTQCYNKKWIVVSIHDSIVILDVEENISLRPIDIKIIINDVYRKRLLHPTVHIEDNQHLL